MLKEYKIIVNEEPNSLSAEAYRKLALNIKYLSKDKKVQVILVASSQEAHSKSVGLMNLAVTYAQKGLKVIALDADFRAPKLHLGFGLENNKGLKEVIKEEVELADAIIKTETNVDVLLTGKNVNSSSELIENPNFDKLVLELRKSYDVILIDCAPLNVLIDALSLTRLSDGVLFVTNYLETKKELDKEAIKSLRMSGAFILGALVTEMPNKEKEDKAYFNDGGNK